MRTPSPIFRNGESTMEKAKNTFSGILTPLQTAPLWLTLLIMLGLRLFLRRPWGFVAALALLLYWTSTNKNYICWQMQRIRCWLIALTCGYLDKSLWYDNEGRTQIMELVERLSKEDKYFCNLADEIKLPSFEHWYAISKELNKLDITTQYTKNCFYISWSPNDRGSGKA